MAVEKRVSGSATQTKMKVFNDNTQMMVIINRECNVWLDVESPPYRERVRFLNQFFANSFVRGPMIRVDLATFNYGEGPYSYD